MKYVEEEGEHKADDLGVHCQPVSDSEHVKAEQDDREEQEDEVDAEEDPQKHYYYRGLNYKGFVKFGGLGI